jgi:hypothetical protein
MSSYDYGEINPNVLADVTRVVEELMRMQKQQQQQEAAASEEYNHQQHQYLHDPLDGASSASHNNFDTCDTPEHAGQQDVDIELLSVQEQQPDKQGDEVDQSIKPSWTADQPPLLPSSASTSSLSSPVSPTASTSSSSSYCTAPSMSEAACSSTSTLLQPLQLDEQKDPSTVCSPAYLAAPITTPINTNAVSDNGHGNANSNGSTQTSISQPPDQKTPTRATANTKGPSVSPDVPDHQYFDHDNDPIPKGSTLPNTKATPNSDTSSKGAASSALVVPRVMPLPPTRPRRKKALLIGINYFGDPNQLLGCINDTRDVCGFLNGYYGFRYQDTIMLTDDQIYEDKRPTATNIRYWMKWLVKDAEPQDSLFFHYAGRFAILFSFEFVYFSDFTDMPIRIVFSCCQGRQLETE